MVEIFKILTNLYPLRGKTGILYLFLAFTWITNFTMLSNWRRLYKINQNKPGWVFNIFCWINQYLKKNNFIPYIQWNPEFSYDYDNEYDNKNTKQSKWEKSKVLKIESLFHILYYNLHYGRRSTLFDIMNTHVIYQRYRSTETIFQKAALDITR